MSLTSEIDCEKPGKAADFEDVVIVSNVHQLAVIEEELSAVSDFNLQKISSLCATLKRNRWIEKTGFVMGSENFKGQIPA